MFKAALAFPKEVLFVARIKYLGKEINPQIGMGAMEESGCTRNVLGDFSTDWVTLQGGRISEFHKELFGHLVGKKYTLEGSQNGPMLVVWKEDTPVEGDLSFMEFFEDVSCFIAGVERLSSFGYVNVA